MIGYHPNSKWSSDTYDECMKTHQVQLDTYVKDRLIDVISVEGYNMGMQGRGTLKIFLKAHAVANNNAVTCYLSNMSALQYLVLQSPGLTKSSKKKSSTRINHGDCSSNNKSRSTNKTSNGKECTSIHANSRGQWIPISKCSTIAHDRIQCPLWCWPL